jgi:CRP-like cAMP-binding protein
VIRQGDSGNIFYIIIDGEAIVTKILKEDGKEKKIMEYHSGDFFGEISLSKNEPRAAFPLLIIFQNL